MRTTKIIISILSLTFTLSSCQAQSKKTNSNDFVINSTELNSKVDALVNKYQEIDIFSGVVLVAEKGKILYHKPFGLANRSENIKVGLNTKFDIGSMNKTFTKIIILQLLEEKKLNLNDNLGMFLSGFPQIASEKITINHLLNHTSGYGGYWDPNFNSLPTEEKRINAIVNRIKKLPLLFEPGTEQEYSNSGYILLGAIIEKITGEGYFDNIENRIIKPMELNNTSMKDKIKVNNRAVGYYKTVKGKLINNNEFIEVPNPDGGFHSTTNDILKFYREYYYGDKLIKTETKMQDEFYNFIEEHLTSGGAIPHAGGYPGANTVDYEILRDKITVIVFSNMNEPVAEQLGAGILAIIRNQEPNNPSIPAAENVYKTLKEKNIDYVRENFQDLIQNFHPTDPKSLILNDVGYALLEDNEINEALQILELNTKLFPEDPNVWDSFGEAHYLDGNKTDAIKYYSKALELDPNLISAKEKIKELSKR